MVSIHSKCQIYHIYLVFWSKWDPVVEDWSGSTLAGCNHGYKAWFLQTARSTGGEKWNHWRAHGKIFAVINCLIIDISFVFAFFRWSEWPSTAAILSSSEVLACPDIFPVLSCQVWQRSVDGCIILTSVRNWFHVWTNLVYSRTVYPPLQWLL